MKRDIFRRGVRMQHQFGDTEKINDPLGVQTFDQTYFPLPGPGMKSLSTQGKSVEVQQYGEYSYREPSSPIQKPSGGMATNQGPAPDVAQIFGFPIPVGTKRRSGSGGPLKTDK